MCYVLYKQTQVIIRKLSNNSSWTERNRKLAWLSLPVQTQILTNLIDAQNGGGSGHSLFGLDRS